MSNRSWGSVAALAVIVVVLLVPVSAAGQVALPRTPDGQPLIEGAWRYDGQQGDSLQYNIETNQKSDAHYFIQGQTKLPTKKLAIVDPPTGRIPYQPWAAEKAKDNKAHYDKPPSAEYVDGRGRCFLPGVPRPSGAPRILQIPGYVVIMIEFTHSYRVIPLGDRPHVDSKIRLWNGDSRGRWEGNTLVVDVTNQHRRWLDIIGNFYTDAVHVVERFTLVDANTLEYEATISDPAAYTKPWKIGFTFLRNHEIEEMWEFACHEGNAGFLERLLRMPAGTHRVEGTSK